MDTKSYKKQRQEIMNFAKDNIKGGYTTASSPQHNLWFRKMKYEHQYLAGNKEFAFSIISIDEKIYMNKIF